MAAKIRIYEVKHCFVFKKSAEMIGRMAKSCHLVGTFGIFRPIETNIGRTITAGPIDNK